VGAGGIGGNAGGDGVPPPNIALKHII